MSSPPRLVTPGADVGWLGRVPVPAELYWVSRVPVAILGMAFPARVEWARLATAGVGHVVCLTHDAPPYDPAPLSCTAVALQELFARPDGPTDPAAESVRVDRAADAVVAAVRRGTGVTVHCRGGRGRAGTVLGVALVELGHDPVDVVTWLDRLHHARGRRGWPESPWQAAAVTGARRRREERGPAGPVVRDGA